jgi:hypothetical protein
MNDCVNEWADLDWKKTYNSCIQSNFFLVMTNQPHLINNKIQIGVQQNHNTGFVCNYVHHIYTYRKLNKDVNYKAHKGPK